MHTYSEFGSRPPMPPSAPRTAFKSSLFEMTQTTATCLWNDSADPDELAYSMDHGAVGATCNPVIALTVLKKHLSEWRPRIASLIREWSTATEDQIGWKIIEEISAKGAALLKPVFDAHQGRNGRLSIQTDPRFYRDTQAIVEQAVRFSQVAPNMIVKIPATHAGIAAMEEATYRGISINATVSFTLPQAVAAAEAVERGLRRREKEGLEIASMGPVCTLMVGRLDDWLKVVMANHGICIEPGWLDWAGIAVFKKAYRIYRERGYRLRLLSAAFRHHMHWSEFIGGDVVISPPYSWQLQFNASDIAVEPRIEAPVDGKIVRALAEKFSDFARAYEEDGLAIEDFDEYGATRRTLRQFLSAGADLNGLIRDIMVPNPDKD